MSTTIQNVSSKPERPLIFNVYKKGAKVAKPYILAPGQVLTLSDEDMEGIEDWVNTHIDAGNLQVAEPVKKKVKVEKKAEEAPVDPNATEKAELKAVLEAAGIETKGMNITKLRKEVRELNAAEENEGLLD